MTSLTIEQLEAQNAMMREALEKIAEGDPCDCEPTDWRCPHTNWNPQSIARQALTSSPSDYKARIEAEALERAAKVCDAHMMGAACNCQICRVYHNAAQSIRSLIPKEVALDAQEKPNE